MFSTKFHTLMLVVCVSATIRKTGWLDKVVEYQRNSFVRDFNKFAPIEFKAVIKKPPPDFVDSEDWTFDSVIRLLKLLRQGEETKPIFHQLRRMLAPTRRLIRTDFESIPSLIGNLQNEFYYSSLEADYAEFGDRSPLSKEQPRPVEIDEDDVIVVSNPVEARLPSAQISVKLLKQILEGRAEAARQMPSTKRSTIPWIPMSTKKHPSKGGGGKNETNGEPAPGGETSQAPPAGQTAAAGETTPAGVEITT